MIKDLSGQKFGILTVLNFDGIKNSKYYWNCKCECGIEKVMRSDNIKTSNSCGCVTKFKSKHNLSHSRFHRIWNGMIARCTDENKENYKYYGGRGIKVCKRWLNFENFIKDMYPTYEEDLTLDRKNPNGNYNKKNCRWATIETQNKNRRNSIYVVYKGERFFLKDLCKALEFDYKLAYVRYKKQGWDIDRVFSEEVKDRYRRKDKREKSDL